MVYKWEGYAYSVDANIVGQQFEKIEKEKGEITSQTVLDEARPESSPIHELFEWDDTVAAEKYRLNTASSIIRCLAIEVEDKDKKPIKCKAFVNVSKESGVTAKGKFINVSSAMENEDTRDIVIKRALNELRAFQNKYKSLVEFAGLFEEIDNLLDKIS